MTLNKADVQAAPPPVTVPRDVTAHPVAGGVIRSVYSRFGTEVLILVGLVLVSGYFALTLGSTFASSGTLDLLGEQVGILVIVAAAQTFPILVGGFDLSVAATMGFASTVAALAMVHGYTIGSAIAFAILAGLGVGIVNGILIAFARISPFVVTLGMLTFLAGFANHLSGGASVAGLPREFSAHWGRGDWGPVPSSAGIGALTVLAVWVVLTYTRLGLQFYAVGGSREASALAGARVPLVEVCAYAFCGCLSALAGVVLAARIGIGQAGLGQGYDLLSIAAVVIGGVAIGGGVGRIWGVVLGSLLLTVVTIGLDIGSVSQFAQQMVTGIVLVVAVGISLLQGRSPLRSLRRVVAVRRRPAAG